MGLPSRLISPTVNDINYHAGPTASPSKQYQGLPRPEFRHFRIFPPLSFFRHREFRNDRVAASRSSCLEGTRGGFTRKPISALDRGIPIYSAHMHEATERQPPFRHLAYGTVRCAGPLAKTSQASWLTSAFGRDWRSVRPFSPGAMSAYRPFNHHRGPPSKGAYRTRRGVGKPDRAARKAFCSQTAGARRRRCRRTCLPVSFRVDKCNSGGVARQTPVGESFAIVATSPGK